MCWSLEDPTPCWKSNQHREPLLSPRVLQGWETKGRWWKACPTLKSTCTTWKSLHLVPVEREGWRGFSPTPHIFPSSIFPRVHCSSCARVCVHPGAGVLVTKQYAVETRTQYLHHHSACLSRCSPNGLATHNNLLEILTWERVVYIPISNKSCATQKFEIWLTKT